MASGDVHLVISVSGAAECTCGVVSPRLSSPAGLRTASNMSSRSRCLLQPASRNIVACSGQITNTEGSASGHQFVDQELAAAQASTYARSSGVLLRWSEMFCGASQPMTVTTD